MPVTYFGPSSSAAGQAPAAAPGAAAAPASLAPMPAGEAVGHGVTRLRERPGAHSLHQPFIPGTPPPRGETAGAHGAHKGRISIR